jgi:hypothetical protein
LAQLGLEELEALALGLELSLDVALATSQCRAAAVGGEGDVDSEDGTSPRLELGHRDVAGKEPTVVPLGAHHLWGLGGDDEVHPAGLRRVGRCTAEEAHHEAGAPGAEGGGPRLQGR